MELLEQDWCRDLFLAFCGWLIECCQAGNLTRRIDNYARFFEVLDQKLDRPDRLSQSQVAGLFTPEELRRSFMVVRFLIERRGIQWRKASAREVARSREIQARLASGHGVPWGPLLESYHDYLRTRPKQSGDSLGVSTIGVYLDAAAGLLRHEDVSDPSDIHPDAPRAYARRRPGYSASLTPFIAFLRSVYGLDVKPLKKVPPKSRKFERDLILEVRAVLARLEITASYKEARALIARSISRLYQIPLVDILKLRWEQVVISDDRVRLSSGWGTFELAPEITLPIRKWLRPGRSRDPVFPGRIPTLQMSRSGVDYHVRNALGIDRAGTR